MKKWCKVGVKVEIVVAFQNWSPSPNILNSNSANLTGDPQQENLDEIFYRKKLKRAQILKFAKKNGQTFLPRCMKLVETCWLKLWIQMHVTFLFLLVQPLIHSCIKNASYWSDLMMEFLYYYKEKIILMNKNKGLCVIHLVNSCWNKFQLNSWIQFIISW